ncbi:thiol-disulfide oxidoreductase DCC family protein [Kiloniella antarctica]|uniref:Thiol-disulfide oxidoreductase DCC family protein n=1 Tax=Kiloniella antarctica TaxID=1550907 RepID=A0ABW5BNH3_9PROT
MSTAPLSQTDYSYRTDPTVPKFDDRRPLLVYDGVCVLCSGFIKFVIKNDKDEKFQFTAAQSKLGQALFRHYNLDTINFETNLLISNGQAYGKMSAFSNCTKLFPYPARILSLSGLIPSPLDNWLYDMIAQNRYSFFGKDESCLIPTGDLKQRFLE